MHLLPTPNASLANYSEEPEAWERRSKHVQDARETVGESSLPLPVAVKRLLPTPLAGDGEGGRTSKGKDRPDPLVRRVDDRRPPGDRSRLSALGDGVLVQAGWLVGARLVLYDSEQAA